MKCHDELHKLACQAYLADRLGLKVRVIGVRHRCLLYPPKQTWRLLHAMPIKSEQPPATITNLSPRP